MNKQLTRNETRALEAYRALRPKSREQALKLVQMWDFADVNREARAAALYEFTVTKQFTKDEAKLLAAYRPLALKSQKKLIVFVEDGRRMGAWAAASTMCKRRIAARKAAGR